MKWLLLLLIALLVMWTYFLFTDKTFIERVIDLLFIVLNLWKIDRLTK